MSTCELQTDVVTAASFPYKATTLEDAQRINVEVSSVLNSIENLLYQRVRKRARGQIDEDQIQEIVQRCRIWLWEKSLPMLKSPPTFINALTIS